MANARRINVPIDSEKLRKILKEKGISMRRLAKIIGYSDKSVRTMIKNGEMSLDVSLMTSFAIGDEYGNSFCDLDEYERRLREMVEKRIRDLEYLEYKKFMDDLKRRKDGKISDL